MTLALSSHGRRRIQQRGVRTRILHIVWEHADVALHAGDGCETFRISRNAAQKLVQSGEINSDDAARACRVALVVGRRGVVTALRPSKGQRGRCYRRQFDTRARRILGASW